MDQSREFKNKINKFFSCRKVLPSLDKIIVILVPFFIVVSALLFKFTLNFHMESDPLWSIGVGEWINNHRAVPHVDVFSWTVAGKVWQSNSWLFCWLMYLADQSMGYLGIALIIFIPCLVTGYLLFLMCKRYHDSTFGILVFIAGVFTLIYITVTPRAYIYTFAFVAIIMYLIQFKRESRLIYIIPLVMLIWVNVQTSIRFGMAILFIEALAGTIFFKDRRLWLVTILSFLATLINPYGLSIWEISVSSFLTPGTQYVLEWRAPDFNDLGVLAFYLFIFLIGLLGIYRLKNNLHNMVHDRNKIMILFWFWSALLYSLSTGRAFMYVLLLLAPCFAAFATKPLGESRYLKLAVLFLVMLLFLSSLIFSLPLLPLELEPQECKPVSFVDYLMVNPTFQKKAAWIIPAEAVTYLNSNPVLQERLFNSYIFGGYLLLNNIKVFIDARENIFTMHNVTEDVVNITGINVRPETIIDKYAINTFLLSKGERLIFYLEIHPEWDKKYEDTVAVIFTKMNID